MLQGFFHMLLGIGQSDNANGGGLPDVVKIQFGDGDIKFMTETILEAADHLALILEGMRVGKAEFESEQAYGHWTRREITGKAAKMATGKAPLQNVRTRTQRT
jgi:hypothetical protein